MVWIGASGCEFDPFWKHRFNSLTSMGRLLTTNVHTLDPGVNGHLAKDRFYSVLPGAIVEYGGICSLGS